MVLVDSHRAPPTPRYSGYRSNKSNSARTGLSPTLAPLSKGFRFYALALTPVLLPRQGRNLAGLGSSRFARHYLGNDCCSLFLRLLRCFSSARWLVRRRDGLLATGLPHSETPGSMTVCVSPRLIAAYHVFLRRWVPRHPPHALRLFHS
jgi:hypothetical protein